MPTFAPRRRRPFCFKSSRCKRYNKHKELFDRSDAFSGTSLEIKTGRIEGDRRKSKVSATELCVVGRKKTGLVVK